MQYKGLLVGTQSIPISVIYYSIVHSIAFGFGVFSFIYFWRKQFIFGAVTMGILLFSRMVQMALNVVSILENKKLELIWKLVKYIFYYDDIYIYSSTYLISYGMKHIVYFYIQGMIVLVTIVSQNIEDYMVIFCFLLSCFSTITLFLVEEISNGNSKLSAFVTTLNNFLGMVIVLGFLAICHSIDYFFTYNILIVIIYFALRDLKKPIRSLIGSKYDVISPNQMYMIVFYFFKAQYVGLIRMNQTKKHSRSYLLTHNYEYLVNGYLSIILFIQLILDRELNDLQSLQNIRRIFYICTFVFIPFFADIFINMIKFLRFGPYERHLSIDCSKCSNLTLDQMQREYLQFKKNQFQINIYIQNIEWEVLDNLLSVCLDEKERNFKIEYFYDSVNKKESIEIDNHQISPKITLNLYSFEFTHHTMKSLNQIRKNTFVSFKFHFLNPMHIEKKFQIYKELFKYPHFFALHDENSEFSEIKQILPVIKDYQKTMYQIFIFNQEILPYLTINPAQVIYDLLILDNEI